ncbi:zonadhesin-like [Aphis craccivora]|uniref:Zonadhesin-like n=1 Tax=Aphis craccivora TaxID=307492 RepID=A0A6G0YIT9_APHCR|nr:zonadhesin-like [Aphis craccivora]
MKTTKDKEKKIRLNNKIKYYTRLQEKNLNQQDLTKIKPEKQETKKIKSRVNRQLTINNSIDAVKQQIFNIKKKLGKNYIKNTKAPDSCESLINLISTNEQSIKILNDRKRKNCGEGLMERNKNKKSRKSNYQPFLEMNNMCSNISLDDIYYKNNFILTHSFNIIEFSDSFNSLSSPEVKVLDKTYDNYYNHTFSTCLDNYLFKPDDCIKKENDVYNLEQPIYMNKNNSDNNHDMNILKLLLLQYWCFYDFNTQTLFSKVNESKKLETHYSEMLETEKISSTREIYSKFTTTKEASLLRQMFSEISGTSEYEKAWFLYDSFSFKTRKIYSLITKIQSTQNSNSKIIDIKRTSKIYTKLFKMERLLSPHEIYFEITYMSKELCLPKTYSEVTAKFRLSLPITHFKNTKKKVLKKLDLSLNELYSKIAKTKQASPADKLYCKAENASFSYSNLIEFIDIPCSLLETSFNFTVTDRKYYLKTYSRKNLKKKLLFLKSYSRIIVHNKVVLLRTFSEKNIRDQQNIAEIYSVIFFKGTLILKMYFNETIQDKQSILKSYTEVKSKLSMSTTYSEGNLKEQLSILRTYSKKYPFLPITYLESNVNKKLSLTKAYFKGIVKEALPLLDIYSYLENPIEKELNKPNKYGVLAIKNGLTLSKAIPNVSIKNTVSLPNILSEESEVTIGEKCIKNASNINSKQVVMEKKESLKLNSQQITTDEPIVSILDEVKKTTTTEITPLKKKCMVGIGLLSNLLSEEKDMKSILPKKNKTHQKVIRIANEDNTEQSNHDQSSSENCSYVSENSNCKKDDQNHTAIPIFISAESPLGSLIHKDHSCIPECSYCNRKFDLLETVFHLSQIKNPDKQKACLENTTHLIGSDSCLCVGCYKAIVKRTSIKNLKKRACIVMTCEQTVSRDFHSKWMNKLKSLLLINKINFKVKTNEEKATHKIPVCNEHYEQILLIAQCQLCGNRTLQKFQLHKSEVHKYQSILNEDEIPITIKYDILICKPCHIYLLLRRDKTTKMSFELEKHCDVSRIRIINHYRLKMKKLELMKLAKSEINIKKTEEDDKLLLVKSLPSKKRNIFTPNSSMVFKPVSSAVEFVNTTTTVITTTIGTKPLMTTRTMTMAPMSMVLTSAIENLSPLGFNQKTQPTFLDTHPSVPRTIKRPVTTNYRKQSMPVHKLTIPDYRITIPVEKLMSPINRVDKSMTQIKKPKIRTSKPMIPVDKPTVADHKLKFVFTPVLRSIFTSKLSVPKEHVKTPNSVSPIKIPTIVQTDQSLNNSLDSQFKSTLTDFPKLSRQQPIPSILSSTTPDIIQFYKNLRTTYPNGKVFINNLMKLETRRNLGHFTVQNNKTIHHQRKSCTATTPPHMIHYLSKPKEYQTSSHIYNYNNDLTDTGYFNNKCVISENDKGSDSLFIPVKTTYKSYNKPKLESISFKNVIHKPSQHNNSGDIIPIPTTTITTTTTEALTNVICATSPILSTFSEAITASEVLTNIEMDSTATNTSTLIIAASLIPLMAILPTVATDLEESTTTNIASAVSSTIDADSITAITTTVIHDTDLAKINSESSTITNLISTEYSNATDAFTTINATTDISGITTTTAAISTTTIPNITQCMSNQNSIDKLIHQTSLKHLLLNYYRHRRRRRVK